MVRYRQQQGTVLGVSLLILVVMTALGVSAMLGSNLQERMVANQKQAIEASMAAESGAVMAIRWLRAHPEAWGDGDIPVHYDPACIFSDQRGVGPLSWQYARHSVGINDRFSCRRL